MSSNTPRQGTRFASIREVLSLENGALGQPDVDRDRLDERRFVPPQALQDFFDTMAVFATVGRVP